MDGGGHQVQGGVHVLGLLPHIDHDPLSHRGHHASSLGIALYNEEKDKRMLSGVEMFEEKGCEEGVK